MGIIRLSQLHMIMETCRDCPRLLLVLTKTSRFPGNGQIYMLSQNRQFNTGA